MALVKVIVVVAVLVAVAPAIPVLHLSAVISASITPIITMIAFSARRDGLRVFKTLAASYWGVQLLDVNM